MDKADKIDKYSAHTKIIIIEDGKVDEVPWGTERYRKESEKNNSFYKLESPDGEFVVIDYDKDKARPYVKALLAKVNRLKEVKMLWWLISICCLFFLVITANTVWILWQLSSLSDQLKIAESKIGSVNQVQMMRNIQTEQRPETVESSEIEKIVNDSKSLLTK